MPSQLSPTLLAVAVTCVGVGAMFVGDRSGRRGLEWLGKPAAALAFLGLGIYTAHGHDTAVTRAFLAALALSLLGDLALMGRSNGAFLAGLTAFLLGHLGFVVAFMLRGVSVTYVWVSLVPTLAVAYWVWRWLRSHVPKPMKAPVIAYMAVISSMVVTAIGTHGHRAAPVLVVAALAFFVSDIAVARQKFVEPSITNRYWGLPLYFGAQLLFASHLLA